MDHIMHPKDVPSIIDPLLVNGEPGEEESDLEDVCEGDAHPGEDGVGPERWQHSSPSY